MSSIGNIPSSTSDPSPSGPSIEANAIHQNSIPGALGAIAANGALIGSASRITNLWFAQLQLEAKDLVDFYSHLPLSGMPIFSGTLIEQANQIRSWMKNSPEVQNCQALNLSELELTSLPPEIGLFNQLKTLILSDNRLRTVPSAIGDLSALTTLSLSNNELRTLPSEIGKLSALRKFYLSGNQFNILPASLKNLLGLTQLDLSNNQLHTLPDWIGSLSALTKLTISGNKLNTLTDEIGNLLNLTQLDLSNNQLQTLPDRIKNLIFLTDLNLSGNQIQTLPSIESLSALVMLDLSDNQLQTLPGGIGSLRTLSMIYLSGNQLDTLPKELENLSGLTQLHLSRNRLQTLPDWIKNLSSMTWINVSENQIETLPEALKNLSAIKLLDLTGNQIETFPAWLGSLSDLTEIDFSSNQLNTLPSEIKNLSVLTRINLSDNQISSLPSEIGSLSALTEMDLSNNELLTLPDEIGNLSELIELNLSENQLTALPDTIYNLSSNCQINVEDNRFTRPYIVQFQQNLNIHRLSNEDTGPEISFQSESEIQALAPPNQTLAERLNGWFLEFQTAFPQEQYPEFWNSHTTDFEPLTSLSDPENMRLNEYLRRLREIDDYQNSHARQNITLRVDRMIQLACKNPVFKENMLALITEGLNTCGDRILIIFNEIEIQWCLDFKELTDDEFKSLAIRISRYELLKKHALEVGTRLHIDKIGTILYYHLKLKDSLNLPISTQGMIYGADIAFHVNQEMLDEALGIIMSHSNEELLEFSQHWESRVAKRYKEQAEQIHEKYTDLIEIVKEYYDFKNPEDQINWLEKKQLDYSELEEILNDSKDYDEAVEAVQKRRLKAISKLNAPASSLEMPRKKQKMGI